MIGNEIRFELKRSSLIERVNRVRNKIKQFNNLDFLDDEWFDSTIERIRNAQIEELEYVIPYTILAMEGGRIAERNRVAACLDQIVGKINITAENKDIQELKNKLESPQFSQNISQIFELIVLFFLNKKFTVKEFFPTLKNGKKSDCKVEIGKQTINVEITQLGSGLFQEKFLEICKKCLRKLMDLHPTRNLQFFLNVNNLKYDSKGHLLVEESVEHVLSEIQNKDLDFFLSQPEPLSISGSVIQGIEDNGRFLGIEVGKGAYCLNSEITEWQVIQNINDEMEQLEEDSPNVLFLGLGTLAEEWDVKHVTDILFHQISGYEKLSSVILCNNFSYCDIFYNEKVRPSCKLEDLTKSNLKFTKEQLF